MQNHPSPPGVDDWLALQVRTAKAVRAIDPDTPIILEVDQWDSPPSFTWLKPIDVPHVIYQAHMYWPGTFTHQGVFTNQGVAKDMNMNNSVTYPGVVNGQMLDREALRKYLQPVRDFQEAYHVPVFIGEFSAIRWAPGAAHYIDDCISIFEDNGWDWCYHAFREWPGWSVEHANLPYDRDHHPLATSPTDREIVLKKWLAKNAADPTGASSAPGQADGPQ
ncbi:MAG: cellulase family glycosylhydrolase [Verrucomicrobiota bacterium]